ncbi:MAG TPA: 50S ribosomal protein L15 [Candidatus Dependentiae bacterium]|nr:50S ribosomal protein L15 [Candidatus Dependentiae bacterium]HRQ62316.1 50S ribosomal protein L15 [Candidatus Dependentiae bacterium]
MAELHKLKSSGKKMKRVGRGGSRGGTSGRGHKGQRARTSGNAPAGFEGGQMPLYRRLPKRGFNNARFQCDTVIVNLVNLDSFNDGDVVTREELIERGIIKRYKSKKPFVVKILGDGELTKKLIIHADAFSQSAKQAVEQAGGEAKLNQER